MYSADDVDRWASMVHLPSSTKAALKKHRIDGKALLNPSLQILLTTAGMPFGDWNSFAEELERVQQQVHKAKQGESLLGLTTLHVCPDSLCACFAEEREVYLSTVGVHVTRLSRKGLFRSKDVDLLLVDFAGQPEYYVPHSLFLRQSNAVYVVVVPFCLPVSAPDPSASSVSSLDHYASNAIHSASPYSQQAAQPFARHIFNDKYRTELLHQLKSLCTTFPQSGGVPVIVAITHLDVKPQHIDKPDMAVLQAELNELFSPLWRS
jgi:hypothetical protein